MGERGHRSDGGEGAQEGCMMGERGHRRSDGGAGAQAG